jgi:hypothetical protein
VRHSWVSAAIVVAITAETFVAPLGLFPAHAPASINAVLAGEPRAIVAYLPLAPPSAPQYNARFMLASTLHWRPLLNGYSGFLPGSYVDHWQHLGDFPSARSLAYLEDIGVTHVIFESGAPIPSTPALVAVASDGGTTIFRLRWDRIDSVSP